jgi:hypothetical protein
MPEMLIASQRFFAISALTHCDSSKRIGAILPSKALIFILKFRTLTPLVLVRIQVPQPTIFTRYVNDLVGFLLPETSPFRVASVRDKFR